MNKYLKIVNIINKRLEDVDIIQNYIFHIRIIQSLHWMFNLRGLPIEFKSSKFSCLWYILNLKGQLH